MSNNSNSSTEYLQVKYKQSPRFKDIDNIEIEKIELKKAKKDQLDHLYNENYQPAKYTKALQYRNARSYMKKMPNGQYRVLQTLEDVSILKTFGLGPFFFIDYMRRITWIFLLMSILQGIRIYINSISSGLSNFTPTFSTYLINTTMGNYNGNVLTKYDNYIMAIIPGVCLCLLLVFYLFWKAHYYGEIADDEEDNSVIKPEKFCIEVQGLDQKIEERDLQRLFSTFGPVYEVSLVRRFKNKLSYFQELDSIQEEIKQEELQIILGSGDQQNLAALKRQKEKLTKFINTLRINPKLISAFIHFQYQKSKVDCLAYYSDHYLFASDLHSCMNGMCCCCIDTVEDKYLYKGRPLKILKSKVSDPEDINWQSYEIDGLSKFFRVLVAIIIILVFILISCSIIALCSIYINTHSSDCSSFDSTLNCVVAACTDADKTCYCNKNLFAALNNSTINTYCGSKLNQIYIAQGIQYAVVAVSVITNFLFGFIVDKIVNFTRPSTYSSGLIAKTTVYTFFLIVNTVFVPILIYSNIYGFKTTNYASLLTIISSDLKNAFRVSELTFYLDFERVWYSNVSPIFTNYLIFNTIMLWVFFLYGKCTGGTQGLKDDEGTILQKSMNQKITDFKFSIYQEFAQFNLVIFMGIFLSAGIPVMIPLAFINLLSKYITSRNIIQTQSSKIQGLGQDFMAYPLTFLPALITVSSLWACWMLTANSNLTPPNIQINIPVNLPLQVKIDQITRQLYLPFFVIIALITLVWFFFENTIVRFISWLSSLCFEKKQVVHPYHTKSFSDYAKTMNVLTSYNIRNNDQMRNIILNLEKYLVVNEDKL